MLGQKWLHVQQKHFVLHQNDDREEPKKATRLRIVYLKCVAENVAACCIPEKYEIPVFAASQLNAGGNEKKSRF